MKWENNKTTSQEKSWEEKEIPPKKKCERERERKGEIDKQARQ